MKNSYSILKTNTLSRKFGGTIKGVAAPYLSGTFFIQFAKLPDGLKTYIPEDAGIAQNEIASILQSSCTGVTPPGGTLSKVEFTGLGGIKWAVPGAIEYGNSVSLKFIEFSGTPILSIFHAWVKMIRDYKYGVSHLRGGDGVASLKVDYAAILYYWTTDPSGVNVEYYACYDGVFPTKDPQDLFSGDVETVGKLDVEIEFNVDTIWHEDWVKAKCQSFLDDTVSSGINSIDTNTPK